ncbi:MAG: molybdopterin molybdenumtransferase MoeA, partial [Xanthomonadaceae bacterium]|nr:molybdopterin molybdenumtransferase MoeA [Xanthomonadaceae bacterium]
MQDNRLMQVTEARARLLESLPTISGEERVALTESPGRVLARPSQAAAPVPPFDNSAMDGYACNSG